ncbi:uncharacterized protein LOC129217256 [Uloborus diversus]|uniref:uncharacterized protein LOC129217256 n=1 Tax=Uloborus diversus TaxID=327109 RepID=UPI00240960F4|nr:uncharacterized protein LOC129217256 [Uloborus diversus]
MGFSAAVSTHRICQAFRDSAVSEQTARHWFQKFSPGALSLCHDSHIGRPPTLENEVLDSVINEDSSLTCGELARQFQDSDKTIILHLHRLGKSYMRSNQFSHEPLEIHKN